MTDFSHPEILDCVKRALEEDIGTGDVTSQACMPADGGCFVAREQQMVAGTELLPLIYEMRGGVDGLRIAKITGACPGAITHSAPAVDISFRLDLP